MHTLFLDQWNNNCNFAKKLQDCWKFEILKKNISLIGLDCSPKLGIPKRNGTIRVVSNFRKLNLLLKHIMSTISISKGWEHDPFSGRVYPCFSTGLKYELLSHQAI
jgi:hypothetical protein